MKGCLARLFWMLIGASAVIALWVGSLALAPTPSSGRPPPPRPAETTTPDITLTISEAYLNRKIAQALQEAATDAGVETVPNPVVDVQPGEKILITLDGTFNAPGFTITTRVELEVRVEVEENTLKYRLEHIRAAGVSIPRGLLPGPLQESVKAVEEEMMHATREQFNKVRLYPTRVRTTDTTLVLELKEK